MRWDPERRPTAQQSLKYPYFQMLKPTQPANQSHREPTATTSTAGQFLQNSTSHIINNAGNNNNYSGKANPQYSNGLANGRVSNVSFASYDKVGSFDKVVDENQQLLVDKATPLKTTSDGNTTFQPTTINLPDEQSSQEQKLTIQKSPIDPMSNRIASDDMNLSLLNGMFSSMGNSRRPNLTKTDSILNEKSTVEGRSIGAVSNLSGSERINDIYVNRNVAALYNSSVRDTVIPKPSSKTMHISDDPFSGVGYKGFYLHGSRVNSRLNSELNESKVYNAFSRKLRPDASATIKQTQVRSWDSLGKQEPVSFEDDELTNILG